MVTRLLHMVGLLAIISAGIIFVLCVTQWVRILPGRKDSPEMSVFERYKLENTADRERRDVVSPLVKQATAYALYLSPPKPPTPKATAAPTFSRLPAGSAVAVTAKFRLLATAYYRSSPERSLALVSEPGKGDHWVKEGERLGHFLVEKVEKEGIVYRDGNQSREMKVMAHKGTQFAQIKSDITTSTPSIKPNLRLLNVSQSSQVE